MSSSFCVLKLELLQLLTQRWTLLNFQSLFHKLVESGLEDIGIPSPKEKQEVRRFFAALLLDRIFNAVSSGDSLKVMNMLIVNFYVR